MRRAAVGLVTTALFLAVGCGGRSYETRLGKTLEKMAYVKKLDDNLHPAPTKGKLEQQLIFIRPPKSLEATPSKEFQLTVLEPGKFDVAESFYSNKAENLFVLARVKRPASPAAKKAPAPAPENSAVRADFTSDVLSTLAGAFNVEIDPSKAKEENKRGNKFKHLTFEANGKTVQVYIQGAKGAMYEVALIFAYPKDDKTFFNKADYALGAFETGERARLAFSGGAVDEEGGETASAPVAF